MRRPELLRWADAIVRAGRAHRRTVDAPRPPASKDDLHRPPKPIPGAENIGRPPILKTYAKRSVNDLYQDPAFVRDVKALKDELHVDQHEDPIGCVCDPADEEYPRPDCPGASALDAKPVGGVKKSTLLQPGLTMTRPMDGEHGRGIIPRHAEKVRLACGAPEATRVSQVYDEARCRWSLAIALPGRPWMLIPSRDDFRVASGLEPSYWGGLYDLRSLGQIKLRLEATERGGYC